MTAIPWIITRDLLADEFSNPPTKRLVADFDETQYPVYFKLWDDDGVLYFEGRAVDEDAVEDAHDWGMGFAGTTRSATAVAGGPFESFIG